MSSLYLEHVERMLECAEDNKDLDSFNYWLAERFRVLREGKDEEKDCSDISL